MEEIEDRTGGRKEQRKIERNRRRAKIIFFLSVLICLLFFLLMLVVADQVINRNLGLGTQDRILWIDVTESELKLEVMGRIYNFKR